MLLDQQALSLIPLTAPAEPYHHGRSPAPGLDPPRQHGIPGGEKYQVAEPGAPQACPTRRFHDQKIAAATVAVARPFAVKRLNDHKFGRAVRFLFQALTFFLGKLGRNPMRAVQPLNRGVSALAEAQSLALRGPRDISRLEGESQAESFFVLLAIGINRPPA